MKNTTITSAISATILGLMTIVLPSTASAGGLLGGPSILPSGTTAAGNDLFEFTLDISGMEGTFDTFELRLTSAGQIIQTGVPATFVSQPSEDSGFSEFLTAPVSFGGQELSAFGINASTDTTSLVAGTFASLGSNAASNMGNYLIAQVTTAGGSGDYQISFFDDGVSLGAETGTWSVPEPSAFALAIIPLFCLVTSRRRR